MLPAFIKDLRGLWCQLFCTTQWTIESDLIGFQGSEMHQHQLRSVVNSESSFNRHQITIWINDNIHSRSRRWQITSASVVIGVNLHQNFHVKSSCLILYELCSPTDGKFCQITIYDQRRISMISTIVIWRLTKLTFYDESYNFIPYTPNPPERYWPLK